MTHSQPFFQEILDNPTDIAPRLRYADWLLRQGSRYGALIQTQCQLTLAEETGRFMPHLEARECMLLAECEQEWRSDLTGMVDWAVCRRGFIEEISLGADGFLRYAEQLFEKAPILDLHLDRMEGRLPLVLGSQYLLKVRFLDLSSNRFGDEGACLIAQAPNLNQIEGLNLTSTRISNRGLAALAESPHLRSLKELYLGDNYLSSEAVSSFLATPFALRLNTVSFQCGTIEQE